MDGIIEGTVQRSGERVRVTAQLIQVSADQHLWASSYERDLATCSWERDVAGDIARQVQARVTPEKHAQLAQPRPVNPAALAVYLQGNAHMHKFQRGFGDEELRLASEYFRQVIDIEPDFAPAYVGMFNARHATFQSSGEDLDIARKAAERAVQLDPIFQTPGPPWEPSGAIFGTGREQNKTTGRPWRLIRTTSTRMSTSGGFSTLTVGWMRAGKKRRSLNNWTRMRTSLNLALENRHEYDRIIQHIRAMLTTDPDNGVLHYMLYGSYSGKRMYKEAFQQLEQALVLFGFQDLAAKVRLAFAASGYKGAERAYAECSEQLHVTKRIFMPLNLAAAYSAAGDKDRAFYWLEQGYKNRGTGNGGGAMIFLNRDPGIEQLHSDPRYKDLLRRVGLPQ